MPEIFYRLPQTMIAVFQGRNLWWHITAIVLTIGIVMSGGDWSYHLLTTADVFFTLTFPAMIMGMFVPVFGTLMLLLFGELGKNRRIVTTAWALGQSAMLGWLISSTYKAFTGRQPPPFAGHFRGVESSTPAVLDSSHGFQFGLLKGGIFWGWPSSHTTVAFAMATCLITLYPKNKTLVFVAAAYALYIGLGVSVSIHWLSEFVAGAIIGSVIGTTVGKNFQTKLAVAKANQGPGISLMAERSPK